VTAQPLIPRWAPGTFLDRLPPDQVTELLRLGVRRVFDTGRTMLREGERSTHVELVIRGFVKVTNLADGVEVLVGIRMPGDLLGEVAGLTGGPRIATATACGRVTSVVVRAAEFHRFLRAHPEATFSMGAAMGDRLRWANTRRTDFAAFPAEVRLARLLVDIATACGRPTDEGITIAVALSQPELATMIGVSEATVHKAFRDWREAGVLRTGYRRVTVVDLPALRALGAITDEWRTETG
jgi:CRP-like cAMP-binding protein